MFVSVRLAGAFGIVDGKFAVLAQNLDRSQVLARFFLILLFCANRGDVLSVTVCRGAITYFMDAQDNYRGFVNGTSASM